MRALLPLAVVCLAPATSASAQDAVTADPKHYKVELENAQVRILRVTYGPGEKSVMHSHPANVAVFLTDAKAKFTLPDGKIIADSVKAGMTRYGAGETHLPENTSDKPFELILVEVKGK